MFVSSTIIAIGIAVPWVLKSQFSMFVYAALMGLGYGIYMVVDQALNVDALPNPNEAGKALGILNLANTLGTGYRADCRLLHRGGHRRLLLSIPDRHRGRNDRCRGDSVHQEGEVAAGGS